MSWQDRLRDAVLVSPSGQRFDLTYEDVKYTFDKKTTGFEFPDADGTFVQESGYSGRRYPLRLFFWGNDYDTEAALFESALLERGVFVLEHPIYGVSNVIPFGTITRNDKLKTAANQAVFDIVFWETIDIIYPSEQTDPASEVLTAVDEYNDAVSKEFEEITSLDSAIEQTSFKNSYKSLLDGAKSGLQAVADAQEDVQKQFDAISDSINEGIDILVGQPLALAFQTTLLLQSPARALTSITARLSAYGNLASSIFSGPNASPGNDARNSNEFHTDDLYASTYVTGSIISVVNNQFTTKTEALEAAEIILAQFEAVTDWRDNNFESLSEIDTGGSYQQLQEAVALTAGFLVQISFTLKQEYRVVLDRNRTIIDMVAELYGSVDDQLDFFINSNNLTGSEILELPKGREIVFYL